MRLAVFTHHFPSRNGSTYFARDVRALVEAGCEIDIFAFYPGQPELWRDVPEILTEKMLRGTVHHVGLTESVASLRPWPLRKFGRFMRDTTAITLSGISYGLVPTIKSIYVYPKAWAWARRHFDEYDHVLAYWGNYAGTCAYLFHRLLDRVVPFSTFLHAIDLYQDQIYLRQKLLYADNIIVVCDYNRRYLKEHFGDIYDAIEPKLFRYHLGLDLAEFPYQPQKAATNRVVAVGSFETVKGFEYLIRAAHKLRRDGIDLEIELIGEGELEPNLKALARRLGIDTKIFFRGWLPFAEARTAMENATILVLPSLGDAVPTVIKEAMALGPPVIATSVGGIPELLDHGRCGILVAPKDVEGLADALRNLLQQPETRQRYAAKARRYAEETFDLWRNGQQLAQLLFSSARLNREKTALLQTSPIRDS